LKLWNSILRKAGKFIARRVKTNWWNWLVDQYGSDEGKLGKAVPGNYYRYLQGYADTAWVFKCVSVIATCAAGVPIRLYRGKGDKKVEITQHIILDLLDKVNDHTTSYDLKELTFSNMEITGNQYWYLKRNAINTPREIFPLRPDRMQIVPDKEKYILGYLYTINGKQVPLNRDEVIHFKYFNPTDDYYGLSQISAIRTEVDTEQYSGNYNRRFFKNNGRVDVTLETDEELDDPSYKRIRTEWKEAHQGEGKEHGIAILERGLKYKANAVSPKDMDFGNLRKMSRETICGILGVKPAVVGLYEYASYANAEIQYKMFWQDTEIPKITKFIGTLNEFLIPMFGDEKLHFEADYSNIEALKENEVQNTEIDTKLIASGVETINERRAKRGLKSVPWGDVWWAPFSLSPVSSAEPAKVEAPPEEEAGKVLKKVLTDEQKRKKWDLFVKNVKQLEDKFKPVVRKFFREQKAIVLENLNRFKSAEELNIFLNSNIKIDDGILRKLIAFDDITFDSKEESLRLAADLAPVYTGVLTEQAMAEIDTFGFDIVFDVENPRVAAWVKKHGLKRSKLINAVTQSKLRTTIEEGISAGEGIPDLAKRVSGVYGEATKSRTITIARTETVGAANQGALESYKQTGLDMRKAWLPAYIKTRETHADAGRKYSEANAIPLDDNFQVGSGSGASPGQIGVAEEDINCMCTLIPVVPD